MSDVIWFWYATNKILNFSLKLNHFSKNNFIGRTYKILCSDILTILSFLYLHIMNFCLYITNTINFNNFTINFLKFKLFFFLYCRKIENDTSEFFNSSLSFYINHFNINVFVRVQLQPPDFMSPTNIYISYDII